ncbi:hypothetical protein GCM10012275_62650 [Longimycelium tulufanense]|uniref:AAA+ ATPase domain-containing protein n=1 Tax=Longimycelium tulufanense TaxID=907463 RepID=A0A8J3CKN9_9PSEU|nr:tetratricopeptide repeat protein [Longimycelium tulufanense]GGM83487.1 hypothetical protein GCM10012275_62650 [Longimycelium tulufanense]
MASLFAVELERLLTQRAMSWRQLAKKINYSPGWLSKVKNGKPPSEELARLCDEVLEAQGTLAALAGVDSGLRPAQLPFATARFVGRDRELHVMQAVLGSEPQPGAPRIVALDGPPGVGKTALALRAAHDMTRQFPDGQLYVDLYGYSACDGPATPDSVLEEFLAALGIAATTIPPGVEQRAKLYRSALAGKRVLVVLDNAACSGQIEPLIPGAAGCGVIVTSRRRLSGLALHMDARQLTLRPMTEDEAATLLLPALGPSRAGAEPAAVAALAQRCGYLPLALRIAANQLASHPHLSVEDLVNELGEEARRLDRLAAGDSVPVRTAFSWSYRDLSGDAARTFRLLGLHRGPQISVDATAALVGTDISSLRRCLEQLGDVHLLERLGRDRYRFHDLLRVYAAERAAAEDTAEERAAAVRQLVGWYLHTAARANRLLAPFRINPLQLPPAGPGVCPLTFDDDVAALRWCDAERDNFVPVMQLALQYQLYDIAWRFAIALFDYLLLRKPGRVWIATHDLARDAALALADPYAEGWVLTNLAEGYRWQSDFARSAALFDRAIALHRQVGNPHIEAWSLAGAASSSIERGQIEQARDQAQRALDLFTDLGNREGQVWALATLGDVERESGHVENALAALQEALDTSEEMDEPYGRAWTLPKIAEAHLALGNPERALAFLHRAQEICRQTGDRLGGGNVLLRHGAVLYDLGRVEEARASWAVALQLYEEIEDPQAAEVRLRLRKAT